MLGLFRGQYALLLPSPIQPLMIMRMLNVPDAEEFVHLCLVNKQKISKKSLRKNIEGAHFYILNVQGAFNGGKEVDMVQTDFEIRGGMPLYRHENAALPKNLINLYFNMVSTREKESFF